MRNTALTCCFCEALTYEDISKRKEYEKLTKVTKFDRF